MDAVKIWKKKKILQPLCPESFALVDTEGTGTIKRDQIEILMRALGHSPSTQELTSEILFSHFLQFRRHDPVSFDPFRAQGVWPQDFLGNHAEEEDPDLKGCCEEGDGGAGEARKWWDWTPFGGLATY